MTPFAQAAECYNAQGSIWSFRQIIEAHAQSGYVIITPEVFLLARAVRHDWSDRDLRDPLLYDTDPDCWHVYLLAGDWRSAYRSMPHKLPFLSFHRRGRARVMTLEHWLAVESRGAQRAPSTAHGKPARRSDAHESAAGSSSAGE